MYVHVGIFFFLLLATPDFHIVITQNSLTTVLRRLPLTASVCVIRELHGFSQQQFVYITDIYFIKRPYAKLQEHCHRRYPDVHLI